MALMHLSSKESGTARGGQQCPVPSTHTKFLSRETFWLEEIALSETPGPAAGQWLNSGMSQGPPRGALRTGGGKTSLTLVPLL